MLSWVLTVLAEVLNNRVSYRSPLGKALLLTPTTVLFPARCPGGFPGAQGHEVGSVSPFCKPAGQIPVVLARSSPGNVTWVSAGTLHHCFLSRWWRGMYGELWGGRFASVTLTVGPGEVSGCEAFFPQRRYSLRCYRHSHWELCPGTHLHRLPASAALQTWWWLLQCLWESWQPGQHMVSDQSWYCHPNPFVLAGSAPVCDMGFLCGLPTGWQPL